MSAKRIAMGLFIILAGFALVVGAGRVLAQASDAATDSGDKTPYTHALVGTQPDGEASAGISDQFGNAATDTGEKIHFESAYPEGLAPDDNLLSGNAADGRAPGATFSYYQIAGATLRGRSSTAAYQYDGVGCTHLTAGSGADLILNSELHIPDDAVLKYLRVYYYDADAAGSVEGYITRYTPGTATNDLVHVGSSIAYSGGYGFAVSQEITETVSNNSYAYTLIGWPDSPTIDQRICGLRVAYYAPSYAVNFLPSMIKDSP